MALGHCKGFKRKCNSICIRGLKHRFIKRELRSPVNRKLHFQSKAHLLLPPASESFVKLDDRQEFLKAKLRQVELSLE